MLKSLISKGLKVPHRCENRYIIWNGEERETRVFATGRRPLSERSLDKRLSNVKIIILHEESA